MEAHVSTPESLAPWAEIVHGAEPMSVDDLLLWPSRRVVDVWRSSNLQRPVASLVADKELDGEDVIPGFAHRVADALADPLA